mmetsp:Transcript_12693/g.48668  ORF Transcript_12693/g.48668 Transcript_12693/m.48668 type:complete len:443 (-) Transcript_12693:330-1658(-)
MLQAPRGNAAAAAAGGGGGVAGAAAGRCAAAAGVAAGAADLDDGTESDAADAGDEGGAAEAAGGRARGVGQSGAPGPSGCREARSAASAACARARRSGLAAATAASAVATGSVAHATLPGSTSSSCLQAPLTPRSSTPWASHAATAKAVPRVKSCGETTLARYIRLCSPSGVSYVCSPAAGTPAHAASRSAARDRGRMRCTSSVLLPTLSASLASRPPPAQSGWTAMRRRSGCANTTFPVSGTAKPRRRHVSGSAHVHGPSVGMYGDAADAAVSHRRTVPSNADVSSSPPQSGSQFFTHPSSECPRYTRTQGPREVLAPPTGGSDGPAPETAACAAAKEAPSVPLAIASAAAPAAAPRSEVGATDRKSHSRAVLSSLPVKTVASPRNLATLQPWVWPSSTATVLSDRPSSTTASPLDKAQTHTCPRGDHSMLKTESLLPGRG